MHGSTPCAWTWVFIRARSLRVAAGCRGNCCSCSGMPARCSPDWTATKPSIPPVRGAASFCAQRSEFTWCGAGKIGPGPIFTIVPRWCIGSAPAAGSRKLETRARSAETFRHQGACRLYGSVFRFSAACFRSSCVTFVPGSRPARVNGQGLCSRLQAANAARHIFAAVALGKPDREQGRQYGPAQQSSVCSRSQSLR